MFSKYKINASLFLVSFAVFLYQICLLRIISVSDYYHFAFLVVSIALLGFGISGSFLYFFTSRIKSDILILLIFSYGFTISIFLSFILINLIPFDSFKIAWEIRQIFYLFAYYFFLLLPFFFGGSFIGFVLYREEKPQVTYFFNLIGSAAGSILFIFLVYFIGKIGVIIVSTAAGLASLIIIICRRYIKIFSILIAFFIISAVAVFLFYPAVFEIRMSPYKSLPAVLRIPESRVLYTEENTYSRIDVVESPSIKSVPGISLKYTKVPPEQLGLTVDGDNLSPITKVENGKILSLDFLEYIPLSVVYELKKITGDTASIVLENTVNDQAPRHPEERDVFEKILIVEPGGGLDVLASLYFTKKSNRDNRTSINLDNINTSDNSNELDKNKLLKPPIFVLQNNNLVVKVLKDKDIENGFIVNYSGGIYDSGDVITSETSIRNFSSISPYKFDLIILSLSDSYHPISSGAYSLNENYFYTAESFEEIINLLESDGVFCVTRWVQVPPSEGLKVAATLTESCADLKITHIPEKIFAFRSWSTITVLFKKDGFLRGEINILKDKLKELNFDIVYYKNGTAKETNIYNQLASTDYYDYFKKVIESSEKDRAALYKDYYFNIRPATDNCPYFYDFFKFRQLPDIVKYFGKSTQPFGGGGYLVLIAALIIAVLLALLLIILPLRFRGINISLRKDYRYLFYFLALGLGFFFVEMPLIQKFILILGKPAYSLSVILFSLMLSAGVGSFTSSKIRINLRWVISAIVFYIFIYIFLSEYIQLFIISKVLWQRFFYTILFILPLGFFMGIPFPAGLAKAKVKKVEIIPWLWAVNGCASVVGSIAAVIVSIHIGFLVVVGISAALYLVALIVYEYM